MSVAQQRYRAVLDAIWEGRTVIDVAGQWSVNRRRVDRWLARYEAERLEGLPDRSHRPGRTGLKGARSFLRHGTGFGSHTVLTLSWCSADAGRLTRRRHDPTADPPVVNRRSREAITLGINDRERQLLQERDAELDHERRQLQDRLVRIELELGCELRQSA